MSGSVTSAGRYKSAKVHKNARQTKMQGKEVPWIKGLFTHDMYERTIASAGRDKSAKVQKCKSARQADKKVG
jgi:hypothetical protein